MGFRGSRESLEGLLELCVLLPTISQNRAFEMEG